MLHTHLNCMEWSEKLCAKCASVTWQRLRRDRLKCERFDEMCELLPKWRPLCDATRRWRVCVCVRARDREQGIEPRARAVSTHDRLASAVYWNTHAAVIVVRLAQKSSSCRVTHVWRNTSAACCMQHVFGKYSRSIHSTDAWAVLHKIECVWEFGCDCECDCMLSGVCERKNTGLWSVHKYGSRSCL